MGRLVSLGTGVEGLISIYYVVSSRNEEHRQDLRQKLQQRARGRPQHNWKDKTEYCDNVRVSVPKFLVFYCIRVTKSPWDSEKTSLSRNSPVQPFLCPNLCTWVYVFMLRTGCLLPCSFPTNMDFGMHHNILITGTR